MLLHVLRHVDADHRALVIEQEFGERLGELGLADAGRPKKQERAHRPVRVLQPGAGAAHRPPRPPPPRRPPRAPVRAWRPPPPPAPPPPPPLFLSLMGLGGGGGRN